MPAIPSFLREPLGTNAHESVSSYPGQGTLDAILCGTTLNGHHYGHSIRD